VEPSGILVIGVGNEMCGDDALGLHAVQALLQNPVPGVTYTQQSGEGASLIESLRDCRAAIIVDAFSSGSVPGMIHLLDVSVTEISPRLFASSSHAFGVAQAIELSRQLHLLPQTSLLCGIEGASFVAGNGLSDPVLEQLPELLETVRHMLHELACEIDAGHFRDRRR
jgi:hydrogenase maturation protease